MNPHDRRALRRDVELAFFGVDADALTFTVAGATSRHDGGLFGGAGTAIATALAEQHTGRRAVCTTTQFVAPVEAGAIVDCGIEIVAGGRRVSQVEVRLTSGGRAVASALVATAEISDGDAPPTFGRHPDVLPAEDSPLRTIPIPGAERSAGSTAIHGMEYRRARPLRPETIDPVERWVWARVPGVVPTPPIVAYLVDFLPSAIAEVAGGPGNGVSLDNSVRFAGPATDSEWLLLGVRPTLVADGLAYAHVSVWSGDRCVGHGAQSCTYRLFEERT